MYLLIQIPCFNEAENIHLVLKDIPKQIDGIDKIKIQIIDDGSTDHTVKVARSLGVDFIIQNIGNKGLGYSFKMGLDNAIRLGADILVNTDGDNQYPSKYISELIQPIIKKEADIVIANRQTDQISHFSVWKKLLQRLGTKITMWLAGEPNVKDAVSGFRAYSREAMLNINVTSSFSYVLDTTIQASKKKMKIASIDIETNPPTRPSRLFRNIFEHIRRSGIEIIRVYSMYKPLKVFFWLGLVNFLVGIVPLMRFLYFAIVLGEGEGKIQSLILGAVFIIISFNLFALGIIGDLLAKNRSLIEYILKEIKSNK